MTANACVSAVIEKQVSDIGVAEPARKVKRRLARSILRVDVGSLCKQDANDSFVTT